MTTARVPGVGFRDSTKGEFRDGDVLVDPDTITSPIGLCGTILPRAKEVEWNSVNPEDHKNSSSQKKKER